MREERKLFTKHIAEMNSEKKGMKNGETSYMTSVFDESKNTENKLFSGITNTHSPTASFRGLKQIKMIESFQNCEIN